jgi:hypothetical protein
MWIWGRGLMKTYTLGFPKKGFELEILFLEFSMLRVKTEASLVVSALQHTS